MKKTALLFGLIVTFILSFSLAYASDGIYVAYNVSTKVSDAPESCYGSNGILYCARGATGSDVQINAFWANNGTSYRNYGDTVNENTAPWVDGNFIYGLGADGILKKWWENNATQICNTSITSPANPESLEHSLDGKIIYAKNDYGALYAVWAANCTIFLNTSNIGGSAVPVIDDAAGKFYMSGSTKFYAFWASNFTQIWNASISADGFYGTPTIINDVYVGNQKTIITSQQNGEIYAFYENGTLRWHIIRGNSVFQGGAYRNGLYVVGDGYNIVGLTPTVYAYYANNGTFAWSFTNSSLSFTQNAPVIVGYNNSYYVIARILGGSFYQDIYILNLNNGSFVDYVTTVGGATSMRTIVYDGSVFIGSQTGAWKWYAIKIATGDSSTAAISPFGTGQEGRWHQNYYNETAAQGFLFAPEPPSPPIPTIPTNNFSQFSFIAGIIMGAGLLLFLLDGLFGSASLLKNPKNLITLFIGALIIASVITIFFV